MTKYIKFGNFIIVATKRVYKTHKATWIDYTVVSGQGKLTCEDWSHITAVPWAQMLKKV